MTKATKVFLDLEDTIINSWDDPTLINVDSIREWLGGREWVGGHFDRPRTTSVSIFSFAIWDEKDKQDFVRSGLKLAIERALLIEEIVEWLSIEEMQRIVEEWSGFRFESRIDFMQLHGKHWAFTKVCLAREQNTTCILLDDAVPHRTTFDHERQLTIELMPVQLLTHKSVGNELGVQRS